MSHEIAVLDEQTAIQQRRNELAESLGLPALGSQIVSEHGMEWKVLGHTYARDLTSFTRDGGDTPGENPRDLMPVITLKNPSPRLKDFWIATDRCTSRPLGIVDTAPYARPQQAHSNGHWVDHLSYPDSIQFFIDAANIHETIMAHEIAHVWIDIVEGCEDYRVLRDLSDPSRYRQVQHIQSFVLDRKVHEVLRKRGFDLTIIEEHQREALLSLSRAVIAGYVPPYAREAATIAMLIAATLLEQEQGLHNVPVLSLVLAYDGTLGSALRLLKQELPEIYELAEYLSDSVRRHGYSNRESIYRAVDDCLLAAFDFTGDPLRLDEDLEEKSSTDSYEHDKWPDFFPGWSVQAKVEAGKAMAKYDIGSEVTCRVSYTMGGTLQMAFQKDSGEWTPPAVLPHAPSALPKIMMPQSRPRLVPSAMPSHPQARRPVVPQPRIAQPPMPHVPQVPMSQVPRPHVGPKFPTPRSTPSHVPLLPSPFDKPRPYGRDYMPGLGLWLSQARLQERMELLEHPYTYVANNPVNAIDPSGLSQDMGGGSGTCRFSLAAFIREARVTLPGGIVFAGDKRGFSSNSRGYRVQQNGIINLTAGRVNFAKPQPGVTRGIAGPGVAGYIGTPTFDSTTGSVRQKNGDYQIILSGAASDPRFRIGRVKGGLNLAPALRYRVILTVDRCCNIVCVAGDHTRFPSFELWIYQNQTRKRAWGYDSVAAGATPQNILNRRSFAVGSCVSAGRGGGRSW